MTPSPSHRFAAVNDTHSGLNPTLVAAVARVRSVDALPAAVAAAARSGRALSICGARHAMGGQQFATDSMLLDTRDLDRVVAFDAARGLIEVEAGMRWPALHDWLERAQGPRRAGTWTFRQKQSGADGLSIGGCLSANIHGRGLDLPPFVADVEAFTLVDAEGTLRHCSRTENAVLFGLAIGGYGLLGVIATVTLRLARRRKLRRVVEIREVDDLMRACDERRAAGFLYGDFQFSIDPAGDGFLRRGVFSCYAPVDDAMPIAAEQRALTPEDWRRLVLLAHVDKRAAFDHYARHYLATSGQIYWSDTHQMSVYLDDYHHEVDRILGHRGSEVITEIYVPRDRLADFMAAAARDFRAHRVDVIYGTVRVIRRDYETFLAWARADWACVIFNLHVRHDAAGLAHAADALRRLIDLAIACGGSYYLTYHRHATPAQVEACYPQFREFLQRKLEHDPQERFQSDWYRHYRGAFADPARGPAPDAVRCPAIR